MWVCGCGLVNQGQLPCQKFGEPTDNADKALKFFIKVAEKYANDEIEKELLKQERNRMLAELPKEKRPNKRLRRPAAAEPEVSDTETAEAPNEPEKEDEAEASDCKTEKTSDYKTEKTSDGKTEKTSDCKTEKPSIKCKKAKTSNCKQAMPSNGERVTFMSALPDPEPSFFGEEVYS